MPPDKPKVSIITPTANRGFMLGAILDCVRAQDMRDWEWLVHDDGDQPCPALQDLGDPRVIYRYGPRQGTLGDKRNRMVAEARGDVIVQFDDDDYYAPRYVSTMLATLQRAQADIVKLSGFFLYHTVLGKFGYWDLTSIGGHQFVWGGKTVSCGVFDDGREAGVDKLHLSYGFSYVFKRSVWERTPFPSLEFGEDGNFIVPAIEAGSPCSVFDDRLGLCVHVIHTFNTSKSFPQFVIPDFIGERMFPKFDRKVYAPRP